AASRPAATTNAATAACDRQVSLTALRRRRPPAGFPPNTERPTRSMARARYVPDWAVNQGDQRSLPDNLIRAPTWEQAGSGGDRDDLLSLGYPLVGCPFRAENQGRLLPADADCCLIAEVVSKPGARSRFTGRSVSLRLRHVAHCCIARVAGMDWRRCLWI